MEQIPIYTIGYGAREIAEVVRVLQKNQIAYLIDVRSGPIPVSSLPFPKKRYKRRFKVRKYAMSSWARS